MQADDADSLQLRLLQLRSLQLRLLQLAFSKYCQRRRAQLVFSNCCRLLQLRLLQLRLLQLRCCFAAVIYCGLSHKTLPPTARMPRAALSGSASCDKPRTIATPSKAFKKGILRGLLHKAVLCNKAAGAPAQSRRERPCRGSDQVRPRRSDDLVESVHLRGGARQSVTNHRLHAHVSQLEMAMRRNIGQVKEFEMDAFNQPCKMDAGLSCMVD
jgi:hypothetical protein